MAMFVLRLTSDPSLLGLPTDDDFTIGVFSAATGFLVIFTAILGVLGGLFYLLIRAWFPRRARAGVAGVLAGLVGGAIVIDPGGIDFTLLDPLPLAVAMFIVLPALYGLAVSGIVERWAQSDSFLNRSRLWALGLIPLLAFGGFGLRGLVLIPVVLVAAWGLTHYRFDLAAIWRSRPVVWIGRAGLVIVAGLALAELSDDIRQILF